MATVILVAHYQNNIFLFTVVRQYYEVQVYDEFVISGNTAVLKCHVPSFVRDYVTVTSWVRGSGERIVSDVITGESSVRNTILMK